jgi:hypothetical protein
MPAQLASIVSQFTREYSEGGRRAQAIAAGLLDVFLGTERVSSGRINEPSRQYPGDVCIRFTSNRRFGRKLSRYEKSPSAPATCKSLARSVATWGPRAVSGRALSAFLLQDGSWLFLEYALFRKMQSRIEA